MVQQNDPFSLRQQNNSSSHQPQRLKQVPSTPQTSGAVICRSPQTQVSHPSLPSPGDKEHASGQPESERSNKLRMETGSNIIQVEPGCTWPLPGGPLCDSSKQPTSNLCFTLSPQPSSGRECPDDPLGSVGLSIPIPTNIIDPPTPSPSGEVQGKSLPSCSTVAQQTLVPESLPGPSSERAPAQSIPKPGNSVRKHKTPQPGVLLSSRVVTLRKLYKEAWVHYDSRPPGHYTLSYNPQPI